MGSRPFVGWIQPIKSVNLLSYNYKYIGILIFMAQFLRYISCQERVQNAKSLLYL